MGDLTKKMEYSRIQERKYASSTTVAEEVEGRFGSDSKIVPLDIVAVIDSAVIASSRGSRLAEAGRDVSSDASVYARNNFTLF